MLGNFTCFFCLLIFFKVNFFLKNLSRIPSVSNSLDQDQAGCFSGSKLFVKVIISRQQKFPLAGKELKLGWGKELKRGCWGRGGEGLKNWVGVGRGKGPLNIAYLTFTTLWANSADNKLMVFFFSYFSQTMGSEISCKLSPLKTIWIKMSNLFFGEKKKKFQYVVYWKFYPES